jgi:Domain of unknown function (DUF4159)
MTRRRVCGLALLGVSAIAAGVSLAQPFQPGGRRGGRGSSSVTIPEDRAGVPNWNVDEHFKKDVFTFVRIEYDSFGRGGFGGGGFGGGGRRRGGFGGFGGYGGGRWATDFPDSDLNFSFRLQQLTSLKVNPVPIVRRLTDDDLFDYPFIYIIEPGGLTFSPEEGTRLRQYLLNGGFLMVDDFWGDYELNNFLEQMKRQVFPEDQYDPKELPLDHLIFRCVYPLKEKPQVPSIHSWGGPGGPTFEYGHGGNTQQVHYMGINDDKGRLMAIICHNTDLGDGWEREGESEEYFREFSEKKSYPMGINIVTYAMTH